jgi:DNA-binding NarL/FixJ family response regulator
MLRCTEAQGYLFSPPRPAAELLQFFAPDAENAAGSIAANACAGGKHGLMCRFRPNLECGHRLTERECDVLAGILAGVTSKVSARQLNISFRTVELHRARIKEKLGANTASDVVQIMLTKGCSPSLSQVVFCQSQSPDIKVAVSPLAGSVKEPQSDPGDHQRTRAVK